MLKKITKLEFIVESEDLTVWIEGSDNPFSAAEFKEGSPAREDLLFLQDLLGRLIKGSSTYLYL